MASSPTHVSNSHWEERGEKNSTKRDERAQVFFKELWKNLKKGASCVVILLSRFLQVRVQLLKQIIVKTEFWSTGKNECTMFKWFIMEAYGNIGAQSQIRGKRFEKKKVLIKE